MNCVILDGFAATGNDLDFQPIRALCQRVTIYQRTPPEEVIRRIGGAQAVLTNKCVINREIMESCPQLEYIGVTATGCNVVDLQAAQDRGITVTNVPGYSTQGVAQQVFAYLLDHTNQIAQLNHQVQQGGWSRCQDFCFYPSGLRLLSGMKLGIFGFGAIGQQVAKIALGFGMKVLVCTRTVCKKLEKKYLKVKFVSWEKLLEKCDVITIHTPLTPQTKNLFNQATFAQMKPGSVLINTARGGIVNDLHLAQAIAGGHLSKAYLDVTPEEPLSSDSPLLGVPGIVITPHCAWAAQECRKKLIQICADNLKAYQKGKPIHVVKP